MKRIIFLINEEKGFNKIFDKEGVKQDQRKDILKNLNLVSLKVTIEEREEGGYYEFIEDTEGNKLKNSTFNPYHKSLINECFSYFIGLKDELSEFIEIAN